MLLPVDLLIADGGAAARTPVDDARAAVDESLVEQRLEHESDGSHVLIVERETRTPPVARVSHPSHLLVDAPAVFRVPRVDAGLERGSAQRLFGRALFVELPLDDVLCRDRRVVGPGAPLHLEATHPSLTAHGVLDGERRCMAHVQDAGDVGWWERDDECGFGACDIGTSDSELAPALAPLRFHAGPVEMLFHWAIEYMGRPGVTRPPGSSRRIARCATLA